MPPEKVDTFETTMAGPEFAVTEPLLKMPPENIDGALHRQPATTIPAPNRPFAVIVPVLVMPPVKVETSMTLIPAAPVPFVVIVPVLKIPPEKVATPLTAIP